MPTMLDSGPRKGDSRRPVDGGSADRVSRIGENVREVRERIASAAERAGRDPESVRLCAVTKQAGLPAIREAVRHGIEWLGENRVQVAEPKIREATDLQGVRWRMIGHLQRNKARRATELFDAIDAVDSLSLARRLSDLGLERGRPVEVLVEILTSDEGTKGGIVPGAAPDAIAEMIELPGVDVRGLMTMAPFTRDEERIRASFAGLRDLRDRLPHFLEELSMGMTGDYEIAIEEGSTMVRVGTGIFGED